MPKLGLGSKLTNSGLITPGVVTDNLVLKHNYNAGSVIPVSDGAAYFDGSTSYIEIHHGAIDVSSDDFTISAWIMPVTGIAQYDCFIAKRDGTDEGFQFDIREGITQIGGALEDGDSTFGLSGTIPVLINAWQHVCIVVDRSDKYHYYINGAFDVSSSTITGIDTGLETDAPLIIGAKKAIDDTVSNSFVGYICNVGFWNKTLTQPEIKSIMNKNYAGLTTSEKTNLVSWWNLDETIETTNISDKPNIVLDNNASNTEVLDWKSNFGTSGIVENADTGNLDVNADPPYTESYIDNDNYTVRLRALLDGPDDGDAIDHIQVKTIDSLTAGKSYKFVVTVDSISGRFRIRPGNGSSAADMTTVGVHTFYFHKSPSTYWRLERDVGVGDITVSDIKIYDIGYTGEHT